MSTSEKEKLADGEAGGGDLLPVPKSPGGSDASASDALGPIDPQAESRLLRKLDFMLWPVFFVIYMMAFLDRINISNAAIQGMTQELQLDVGNRFNVALFVCFFFLPTCERVGIGC
jgi:hypothetical protein